jgi:hypothetical protein
MAKLKNMYSEIGVERIFEVIRNCLTSHNAKQIVFEYNETGRVKMIIFSLEIAGVLHGFKLPARVDHVERILYPNHASSLTQTQKEQAYRTAWANIRDWITAQMALIDTQMVKPEEVFLPYMVARDGRTYYEVLEQQQFLLNPDTSKVAL